MRGEPAAPESDAKDWTWVLDRPCRECGFDAASVRVDDVANPGRRSNGSVFTVETLAKYFLHDLEHHVRDVSG